MPVCAEGEARLADYATKGAELERVPNAVPWTPGEKQEGSGKARLATRVNKRERAEQKDVKASGLS